MIIGRSIPDKVADQMVLSSVVLYELIAANIDNATFQMYSSWKGSFAALNKLLTPTATDWYECSKLIRNMLRGSRSRTKGNIAKTTSAQGQQNDALIARTAILHDCFIVTDNVRDFERFRPYMNGLMIVSADYFLDE